MQNLLDATLAMPSDNPEVQRQYTSDNPVMTYRNGQWVSIAEHNKSVSKKYKPKTKKLKTSKQGQDKPRIYVESGYNHTCKVKKKHKTLQCTRVSMKYYE